MTTATLRQPPPPALAIEAMGSVLGRWVGHTWTDHTFPVYGLVTILTTWMVAQEYKEAETPEVGLMWQWLIRPGRPVQCFHAMAYRAAETPIDRLRDIEATTYRDSIDLTPNTAWALASCDDPALWYQSMQGSPWHA